MSEIKIRPVARIKNGFNEKFCVPRQSGLVPLVKSEIVFESVVFSEEKYKFITADLEMENVFPLRLQKKIFDLPPQKPTNRPLWG